jgi:hypothetical protein
MEPAEEASIGRLHELFRIFLATDSGVEPRASKRDQAISEPAKNLGSSALVTGEQPRLKLSKRIVRIHASVLAAIPGSMPAIIISRPKEPRNGMSGHTLLCRVL